MAAGEIEALAVSVEDALFLSLRCSKEYALLGVNPPLTPRLRQRASDEEELTTSGGL